MQNQVYSFEEALSKSLDYFGGDELAAKVFLDKYALRDNDGNLLEATPQDMHKRLAKEFAKIEAKKFKKPLSEEEIFTYLDKFKKIVPQGGIMAGAGNPFQVVSLSNCYVCDSPLDDYGAILRTDEQLVQISKRRGGVGIDISHLRPAGTPTQNAARTSTGIISFMERYSNSIREVGQSGRRGALMLSISVHHPEILAFANVKKDRTKITGANISIRLSNEFLKAVEKDVEYELRWPVDAREKEQEPKISQMVRARDIWKAIIANAHEMAEPGLLFWDNILSESPADCYKKEGYSSTSTNPCCISQDIDYTVLTQRGMVEIKQITANDLIYISEKNCFAKTSGYFDAGIAPVFKVEFYNGKSLEVTANHKLCCFSTLNKEENLVPLNKLARGVLITTYEDGKPGCTAIKNVIPVGEKRVGCIEVEEFHKFVVNGIVSGNSEIPLCPLDSCRLLCLNVFSYVKEPFTDKAYFDFAEFYKDVQVAQRLMDDLIDIELEHVGRIIKKIKSDPEPSSIKARELELWSDVYKKCEEGRRTGTGITALGDAHAALGIPYASDKGIEFTAKVYKTLKFGAYRSSVDMARELGSFGCWNHENEKDCPFLKRIKNEVLKLNKELVISGEDLWNDMRKHGRRNIALLTTAPTGTVSIMTQTTSGIEPAFQLSYVRRKKINPNDKNTRVDFVDPNGDRWQEFTVYHPKVKQWMEITGEKNVEKSPWFGCCAEDLDWAKRVELQAAGQRHIDHAISSTLNLPENISVEKVAEIYEMAWKAGCKGITIYRKNSRTGVLIDKREEKKACVKHTDAPKRPKSLPCAVHHIKVTKKLDKPRTFDYLVVVGLYEGEPYEVFVMENGHIDKKYISGNIVKKTRGHYSLVFDDGTSIENITKSTTEMEDSITRMASTALRHGVKIEFVVHQLEKAEGDMWAFSKCMARALKKHIKDGVKVTGETCEKCGGSNIQRKEGCKICVDCGTSKCG